MARELVLIFVAGLIALSAANFSDADPKGVVGLQSGVRFEPHEDLGIKTTAAPGRRSVAQHNHPTVRPAIAISEARDRRSVAQDDHSTEGPVILEPIEDLAPAPGRRSAAQHNHPTKGPVIVNAEAREFSPDGEFPPQPYPEYRYLPGQEYRTVPGQANVQYLDREYPHHPQYPYQQYPNHPYQHYPNRNLPVPQYPYNQIPYQQPIASPLHPYVHNHNHLL